MRLGLLAAAWLAGVFIGLRTDAAALPVLLLFLATLAAGTVLHLYRRSVWPAVLAGVQLLALLRVEAADEPVAPLAMEDGQRVTLRGRIIDEPEATAQRIKLVLAVEAVDRGDGLQPFHAKALAYTEPPESLVSSREPPYFRYGNTLLLEGRLERPVPSPNLTIRRIWPTRAFPGSFFPGRQRWWARKTRRRVDGGAGYSACDGTCPRA